MSTVPRDISFSDANSDGTVRLIFSMEKPEPPASTYTNHQNSRSTKRTTLLWTTWNWVLGRKLPQQEKPSTSDTGQQEEQPSTPDTGNLVIRYPTRGTRRLHLAYMKWQKKHACQSDKVKDVHLVEYVNSEQQHAVKFKGLPIRSVHELVPLDGFRITTTRPEDAKTLRQITGCGVVRDCVLECIPPVLPEEAKPGLSGTSSFIPKLQSLGKN